VSDSSRISPTAHYTSYVWVRNQLSHPALASSLGRRLYTTLWPAMEAYTRITGRQNLEAMLLLRHRKIDELLEKAIESGEVKQVVEIAAGFSARGLRFKRKYPDLIYLEGDLPEQAAEKRRILEEAKLLTKGHEVLAVDALSDESMKSIPRHEGGCAVITEGLLGYFDEASVRGMWARFAKLLASFQSGLYLADLSLDDDVHGLLFSTVFRRALELFARGKVHLHFKNEAEAIAALGEAGFARAVLHQAGEMVRIVEARPSASP
jgi:O-methyltransferase involved in polyketide biosynthesis